MKNISKERASFLRIASSGFILLILFECLFFLSTILSSMEVPASKKNEDHFFPFSLIGVLVSKNNSFSLAILKDEENAKTTMLTTGDSILGMELIHVFENRIILRKGDMTFQIFLGRGKLMTIDKKMNEDLKEESEAEIEFDSLMNNQLNDNLIRKEFVRYEVLRKIEAEFSTIVKEIGFVPFYSDGKIRGFKITKLPKEGIISVTGIYENDVVREVNGVELNDYATLFSLLNKFKNDNLFEVIIERNGKLFRLIYILK